MQNAKDTFYVTLRDRLGALNPARTMVLRGTTRSGVWVEENELTSAYDPTDVFSLRWSSLRVDGRGALPLVAMGCEIRYCTDGNSGNGGMDRGRLLAGMDAELAAAVNAAPQNVEKMNFSGSGVGVTAAAMGTNVFWGDVTFGAVTVDGERLERVTTVEVWAYQETGEL
jgi:hypothetical protein